MIFLNINFKIFDYYKNGIKVNIKGTIELKNTYVKL